MNSFDPHESPGSPLAGEDLIDRLVDGDLEDGERRSLLLRLEAEPDGWRRCALAFLEHQTWRATIGGLGRAVDSSTSSSLPLLASSGAIPRRPRLRPLAAWAAGLAAAFAIGWTTGGTARPGGGHDVVVVQKERVVPLPTAPETPKPETLPTPSVAEQPDSSGSTSTPSPDPLLTDRSDHRARAAPSAVPDYVRSQFERRGYRVEQKRGVLISVRDGRRVTLPVEQVKIRYVGRGSS